jgi:hypothetical protein
MLALYFYGAFHFITLEYPIESFGGRAGAATPVAGGSAAPVAGRLITPAPPRFTTRRAHYNRYEWRYVFILETAFIIMILFPSILTDLNRLLHLQFPSLTGETWQYRSLWALFLLTGFLSSFPGIKEVDRWLLKSLHRAALIPDDVRIMAERLYHAPFSPADATRAEVRSILSNLSRRDMEAVAAGRTKGSLERRLIQLLWLNTQLQSTIMSSEKYAEFQIKLERDIAECNDHVDEAKTEIATYLRDQERLLLSEVPDIDTYLSAHSTEAEVSALSERRRDLRNKCDTLYKTLCLLVAVSEFAADATQDDIDSSLKTLGFELPPIPPPPILDLDAVARVIGSMMILLITIYGAYMLLISSLGIDEIGGVMPPRTRVIVVTLIISALYAIIMYVTIKLKRMWWFKDRGSSVKAYPENLIISVVSYLMALLFFIPSSLYYAHEYNRELTEALTGPFLYAFSLGILGYFSGKYVDQAPTLQGQRISLVTAAWQGLLQGAAYLIAAVLSPVPGHITTLQVASIVAFIGAYGAVSGFSFGVLFQYFYRQTPSSRTQGWAARSVYAPYPAGETVGGGGLVHQR